MSEPCAASCHIDADRHPVRICRSCGEPTREASSGISLTIATCVKTDPHASHVWAPEPRAIHGLKRCPGVPTADEAYDRLHGLDGHTQAGEAIQ